MGRSNGENTPGCWNGATIGIAIVQLLIAAVMGRTLVQSAVALGGAKEAAPGFGDLSAGIEKRVDDLVSRMTL